MKLNKKYLAPLCSLFVTGGLLLSIVVLVMGSSFGWFSTNDKVSASGISVSSISPFKTDEALYMEDPNNTPSSPKKLVKLTSYDDATVFAQMLPGQTRTVYLKVTNKESDTDLSLDLLLSAPSTSTDSYYTANVTTGTGENATTVTEYYYLGSQIRVNKIALATVTVTGTEGNETVTLDSVATTDLSGDVMTGSQKFLLTMPESFYTDGVQRVGATSTEVTQAFAAASQKKMANGIEIEKNETAWIAITFEFAENGQVQNPYIDFANKSSSDTAKKAYVLTREILCWYGEAG